MIEGSGTLVKGNIEFEANGEVVSANLPVFALADGDKVNLKAERGPEGQLKVTLRGEVYDGRGFVKSTAGASARSRKTVGRAPISISTPSSARLPDSTAKPYARWICESRAVAGKSVPST